MSMSILLAECVESSGSSSWERPAVAKIKALVGMGAFSQYQSQEAYGAEGYDQSYTEGYGEGEYDAYEGYEDYTAGSGVAAAGMRICPDCSKEIPEDSNFCRYCWS